MSTDQTTKLGLPFLMPAQAQKHVTVNESLLLLDALVQAVVESRAVSAQPGSPADGAVWILPAGKTGAEWGGYTNWSLAYYRDGSWETIAPRTGWRVWVKDEAVFVRYDGTTWTADLTVKSLNSGPLAGHRNAIMNGDFRIAQRGTSFAWGGAAGVVKTLDRWNAYMGASGDAVARIAAHAGVTRAAASPQAIELTVPVAAVSQYLDHRIEDVRSLAGGPATLSFDAWAASAMTIATIQLVQLFGSGGSSSVVTAVAASVAVGASPARKTFTVAVPSVAGKTIGAGSALSLQILVNNGSAVNAGVLRIADVQLEPGAAATPFEVRPDALELALCQRYYERAGGESGYQDFCAAQCISTTQARGRVPFKVRKRVAPTVTLNGAGSTWAADNTSGSQLAASALSASFITPDDFELGVTVGSGLVAGQAAVVRANGSTASWWCADAEI